MWRVFCRIVLAAGVLLPSMAMAWNASGHLQIAMIAYERLSESKRPAIVDLLRKHVRFRRDFRDRMPESVRAGTAKQKDRWVFSHAATWPDIARGFRGEPRKWFHRPLWHYVNHPLYLSDADRKALSARLPVNLGYRRALTKTPADYNVAQAIELAIAKVQGSGATDREKALFLTWLFHLIGDVHQPLHAVALFSDVRFPKGDSGGNGIEVRGKGSLHSTWDSMLGYGESLGWLTRKAKKSIQDLGTTGEMAAESLDIRDWIEESYDAAWAHVYHTNILEAVAKVEDAKDTKTDLVASLPQSYFENGRIVARQRAVEAGYRLARILDRLGL